MQKRSMEAEQNLYVFFDSAKKNMRKHLLLIAREKLITILLSKRFNSLKPTFKNLSHSSAIMPRKGLKSLKKGTEVKSRHFHMRSINTSSWSIRYSRKWMTRKRHTYSCSWSLTKNFSLLSRVNSILKNLEEDRKDKRVNHW